MTDYEGATAFLGEWGRFQLQVFFLLSLTIIPIGPIWIVFVADTPPHRCLVPAHLNLTAAWSNSSVPLEAADYGGGAAVPSKCSRYQLDHVRNYSDRGLEPGVDVNLSSVPREGCVDGWEYDRSVYISTIVTEWDLVCGNNWKAPLTSSIYFCGILVASFSFGQLSDRYGRKKVLFFSLALQSLFTGLLSFAQSWPVFCALYFVCGMGQIGIFTTTFVLGTEILGPRARTVFSTLGVNIFFVIGYMLLPLWAFFIRDWRRLLQWLCVPGFCCLPFWWFIPESPRWLLSQGRLEEAEAIMRKAAKRNNIKPPEVIFRLQEKEGQSEVKAANICDLLRFPNIRGISLTLWLVWNSLTIAYFALSLNTANIHGDSYFNCFLSALVELPAYILSWVLFRWCPRRPSLFSTLFMGGVVLLCVETIPANLVPLAIALEMTGKFAVSIAYALVYAYTVELYPTVLRSTALCACSMAARIGSIIAPYFIYLRNYWTSLPYILMGSLAALMGLLSLLLPESYGMPLPETIAHIQPFPGCCRKVPYTARKTDMEGNPEEISLQGVPSIRTNAVSVEMSSY